MRSLCDLHLFLCLKGGLQTALKYLGRTKAMGPQVLDAIPNILRALLNSQTFSEEKLMKAEIIVVAEPGFLQLGGVLQPQHADEQGQEATPGVLRACSAQVSRSCSAFYVCCTPCQQLGTSHQHVCF